MRMPPPPLTPLLETPPAIEALRALAYPYIISAEVGSWLIPKSPDPAPPPPPPRVDMKLLLKLELLLVLLAERDISSEATVTSAAGGGGRCSIDHSDKRPDSLRMVTTNFECIATIISFSKAVVLEGKDGEGKSRFCFVEERDMSASISQGEEGEGDDIDSYSV